MRRGCWRWSARLPCLLAVLAAFGCAGKRGGQPLREPPPPAAGYEPLDGPPTVPFDVDAIPEPVPQHEPLARYGNHSPYVVFGKRYEVLPRREGYVERGTASWYGTKFHGRLTSTREPYDMYAFTAAHKTLPLPSYARVTHLENGRSVVVRINDRGPFVGNRIIDLSYAAAVKLGMHLSGTAPVEVRILLPEGTATQRPVPAPVAHGRYSVQAGAFSARENAFAYRRRLREAGFAHVRVFASGAGTHRVYRVRIGPVGDRVGAEELIARMRSLGFAPGQVVSE